MSTNLTEGEHIPNPDPYKIPLSTAQDWVRNWVNFDLAQPQIKPSQMKAFAITKDNLAALSAMAPEANWVRFYIGLELVGDGENAYYRPHLISVNAIGPENVDAETRHDIKDMIDYGPDPNGLCYVNDFSRVCPPFCDTGSALNVK